MRVSLLAFQRYCYGNTSPRRHLRDWIAATQEVRAGRVTAELPIQDASIPPSIEIKIVGTKNAPQPLTVDPAQPQLAKAA
jgi:hypothetical protein